jgi:hypothetical protein
MLQLTQLLTLAARIDEHQRSPLQDGGIDLLLARRIRPDAGEQRPGQNRAGMQNRRARRRAGDDQTRFVRHFRRNRGHLHIGEARQILAARLHMLGITAPQHDALERQHLRVHLRLQPRLDTGPNDADAAIAASELARSQRRRGGRAHVRKMPRVGQKRDRLARLRRGEQHHPVPHGQPALRIARKRRRDLQRKVFSAAPVAGLHVDFGGFRRDIEMHRHRGVAFRPRVRDQRIAHAVDDFGVIQETPDFREFEDAHRALLYRCGFRATERPVAGRRRSAAVLNPRAKCR